MPRKTYRGSCHCKALQFEADLDLPEKATGRCNCTYCYKVRNWAQGAKPDQFRWISGEAEAGRYGFVPGSKNAHIFCKTCGVRIATIGDVPEIGGPFVSIQLTALDDLPTDVLLAAPIHYSNGRDNDWMHPPSETRHL